MDTENAYMGVVRISRGIVALRRGLGMCEAMGVRGCWLRMLGVREGVRGHLVMHTRSSSKGN